MLKHIKHQALFLGFSAITAAQAFAQEQPDGVRALPFGDGALVAAAAACGVALVWLASRKK
ncbi:hypothetical protein [Pseudomaricurvus sp. HS19]|uniref:hypothetical protein n=1 Tax=Pseudomaricurvus sp. HS19 TaxID=2692626 RepID=UPI001369EB92|nr:hypothetical protein [Pseudomaricurvus sp. HS19]MYM64844.1 hypothetical protein [Pseudomaricurvus sp. HS19]